MQEPPHELEVNPRCSPLWVLIEILNHDGEIVWARACHLTSVDSERLARDWLESIAAVASLP